MSQSRFAASLALLAVILTGGMAWAFEAYSQEGWTASATIDNDSHWNWPFWPLVYDSQWGYLEIPWSGGPAGEQSAAITVDGSVSLRSDVSPYPFASGMVSFALVWYDCVNTMHGGLIHNIWVRSEGHGQVAFTEVIRDWCPATATTPTVRVKWEAGSGYQAEIGSSDTFLMTWMSN